MHWVGLDFRELWWTENVKNITDSETCDMALNLSS